MPITLPEMGPLLLARMLGLNDVQEGVLMLASSRSAKNWLRHQGLYQAGLKFALTASAFAEATRKKT